MIKSKMISSAEECRTHAGNEKYKLLFGNVKQGNHSEHKVGDWMIILK
jgi:hypothetical protein